MTGVIRFIPRLFRILINKPCQPFSFKRKRAMSEINSTIGLAARIHAAIHAMCHDEEQGTDGVRTLLLLAGMTVETAFLFDEPEEAIMATFARLRDALGAAPVGGSLKDNVLPPATIIDFDAEQGRMLAREYFEEYLDCPYEFHDLLLFIIQQRFIAWEQVGQRRAESLRLFEEVAMRAMAFELAAQEICDSVIDEKIGRSEWTLADAIGALAGSAGHRLALSHDGQDQCCWFRGSDLPDLLDQCAYVMTQEAVRLGLKCHTDWRFGLPANDTPANPPTALVREIEPVCARFFTRIGMDNLEEQAVACAKAAGRMLAVAAGGEFPEIEPPIAKPLAMGALTESYKGMCVEYAVSVDGLR